MPYLLLVSIIWGVSFGLIKVSFGGIPPAFLSAARLSIALIVFLPLLKFRALGTGTVAQLIAIGAIQYGLMYYLLFSAFAYLDGHQVALYTITTPLFIAAWYSWQQRRWQSSVAIAAALAVIGAAIIQYQPGKPLSGWQGFWLLQGSNACFAYGQLAYKRLQSQWQHITQARIYAWLYFGGVILSVALTIMEGSWNTCQSLSQHQWQALLYLGTVASGLAFFLWNYGAAQTSAATLAVMNNLKIPIAVLLAIFLFGEQVNWLQLIPGAALMLLALRLKISS